MRRDEQHRRVGHYAFYTGMNMAQRRLIIIELAGIEGIIVLVLQFLFGFLQIGTMELSVTFSVYSSHSG